MATLYKTDGTATPAVPANGSHFTLAEMYKLVGCHTIERVGLSAGRAMIIDEDGKWSGKKVNDNATRLCQLRLMPGDVIVGDALLVEKGEMR
ncbi:hypothetical protein DB346_08630 [Verrucomicrobia bacterium LW23]|nr:hypothetical protein DB346_08630 [Verrucomicrobia bacterium LW23]